MNLKHPILRRVVTTARALNLNIGRDADDFGLLCSLYADPCLDGVPAINPSISPYEFSIGENCRFLSLEHPDVSDHFRRQALPGALGFAEALYDHQSRQLSPETFTLLQRIEFPADDELALMTQRGICLDVKLARQLSACLTEVLDSLRKTLSAEHGIEDPSKPLGAWLHQRDLPAAPPSRGGKGFGESNHLKAIETRHPALPLVRRYRRLKALSSQSPEIFSGAEEVHPEHHHLAQATGRTSTVSPAITNLPKELRPLVRAREGYGIVEVDYASMEVGISAQLSQDQVLAQAYDTRDAISYLAREIFPQELAGVPLEAVKVRHPDFRSRAKPVVYGTLYGQSAKGLSDSLGCSPHEAARLQDNLFGACQGLRGFIERAQNQAKNTGAISICPGLKRPLNDESRRRIPTIAANTKIQGAAGVAFRYASVLAGPRLRQIGGHLILPMHDSYIAEIPLDRLEEGAQILAEAMEEAPAILGLKNPALTTDINMSAPHCWNKDGHHDSVERLIADPAYRI